MCDYVIHVPRGGYKSVSIREDVFTELENIRKELGLRSVSEVVAHLVRLYRSGSITSASPAPASPPESPAPVSPGERVVKFSDVMRLVNAIVEYEKAKKRTQEFLRQAEYLG